MHINLTRTHASPIINACKICEYNLRETGQNNRLSDQNCKIFIEKFLQKMQPRRVHWPTRNRKRLIPCWTEQLVSRHRKRLPPTTKRSNRRINFQVEEYCPPPRNRDICENACSEYHHHSLSETTRVSWKRMIMLLKICRLNMNKSRILAKEIYVPVACWTSKIFLSTSTFIKYEVLSLVHLDYHATSEPTPAG